MSVVSFNLRFQMSHKYIRVLVDLIIGGSSLQSFADENANLLSLDIFLVVLTV
jgi:hypothetical protein